MDASEATKIVMSRVQSLDPENASKIMGYILIQDQGEKEMIRLAFSPDALLLSYINQAKVGLGLPSNTPLSYPIRPGNPFPQIMIPNNSFHLSSSPSSPAPPFQRSRTMPINNGSSSPSLHFYGGNDEFLSSGGGCGVQYQVQDELQFLDEGVDPIMSPSGNSDSVVFPYGEDVNTSSTSIPSPHSYPFHRRSCSVNDAVFFEEGNDGGNGFLWRPCMYFARGFCKNGTTCKFLHSDEAAIDVGSPSKTAAFDELLKLKALQQHRYALMASGAHNPFAYNNCVDSPNENLRRDFSPMGLGAGASSSSRQIYLTFPSDSTFKEDDVSNYFSMFGPVQDVRIPYQQKRMFGFVTFVYPETVKLILAKGNPHFVCDSRVLVKPYKEKGKVREKKQQQQNLERGDFSVCLSPSGIDSREQFDHPFGSRITLTPQEMMRRKKFEQEAELQHAIELQGQRMMSLQLRDLKYQNHNHHYLQPFPAGIIPYSSPRPSQLFMNQHVTTSSRSIHEEDSEECNGGRQEAAGDENLVVKGAESSSNNNIDGDNHGNADDSDLHLSLEHILPDNLFASPTKSADDTSPLAMASLKSCYLQIPRFSSGQEKAIEM